MAQQVSRAKGWQAALSVQPQRPGSVRQRQTAQTEGRGWSQMPWPSQPGKLSAAGAACPHAAPGSAATQLPRQRLPQPSGTQTRSRWQRRGWAARAEWDPAGIVHVGEEGRSLCRDLGFRDDDMEVLVDAIQIVYQEHGQLMPMAALQNLHSPGDSLALSCWKRCDVLRPHLPGNLTGSR